MAQKADNSKKTPDFGPPKLTDSFPLKWPDITSESELKVTSQLERVFDKYKDCLITIKKAPKWKKQTEPMLELDPETKQRRTLFKSWFVLGMNSVIKNLEKDKLRLVLMCKTVQPSVMKKAILHLVNEHSCPALCVPNLLQSLQAGWPGLSSATCIGVLKTDQSNDFDELVKQVNSTFADAGINKDNMYAAMSDDSKLVTSTSNSSKDGVINLTTDKEMRSINVTNVTPGPSGPPVVDRTKYYLYKTETNVGKTFASESFISIGSDDDHDVVYKTVNGIRDSSKVLESSNLSFGIRPSLSMQTNLPGAGNVDSTDAYDNDRKRVNTNSDSCNVDAKYRKMNMKKLKFQKDRPRTSKDRPRSSSRKKKGAKK